MTNQPYKIISKKTEQNEFNKSYYDLYELEINNENYKGFNIRTLGSVMIDKDEVLNLDNDFFFHIYSEINDMKGNLLKQIAGSKHGHLINSSIRRVKKYVDDNSHKLK